MAAGVVRAVAFDVNETLFPLDQLAPVFAEHGLDPDTVPLWFARVLRDGFALAAMGGYRGFADVAVETLRAMDPERIDTPTAVRIVSGFRRLDPHPDVGPALRALREAGMPAVTLTNGGADLVGTLLERAGLASFVDRSFSVDDVRRWKPAPEPYRWVAGELGVAPSELALVAAHPWDCAGASAAGLVAAWVNRTGAPWPAVFTDPAVTGDNLTAVVAALLPR